MTKVIPNAKILEVAERYGIQVDFDGKPGFFIDDQEVTFDDLFDDFFNTTVEDEIQVDFKLKKSQTNIHVNDAAINMDRQQSILLAGAA
jgi:hypothetical protein